MSRDEISDRPLVFGILTVSDTRTEETDVGGRTAADAAVAAGHEVKVRGIVKDDFDEIRDVLLKWLCKEKLDAIVTTGGTGIARRDVTIEAVKQVIEKEIPGFGELFRYLSYAEDIGTRAIASRAIAGVQNGTLIFALPGSVGAVTLGMRRLILPEVSHLLHECRK